MSLFQAISLQWWPEAKPEASLRLCQSHTRPRTTALCSTVPKMLEWHDAAIATYPIGVESRRCGPRFGCEALRSSSADSVDALMRARKRV